MRNDSSLGCLLRGKNLAWKDVIKRGGTSPKRQLTSTAKAKEKRAADALKRELLLAQGRAELEDKERIAKKEAARQQSHAMEEEERIGRVEYEKQAAAFFKSPLIKAMVASYKLIARDPKWGTSLWYSEAFGVALDHGFTKEIPISFVNMFKEFRQKCVDKTDPTYVAVCRLLKEGSA